MAASAPDNDPRSAGVIDAVRSLQKSLSNARLYSLVHPKAREPLTIFVQQINEVCEGNRPVTFSASFEGLVWNNTQITRESEDNKGLGHLLLTEGIEQLTFRAGLSFEEVYQLLTLLRMNFTEAEEETLESLLWQANLEHIQFQAMKALGESEALSALAGQIADIQEMDEKLDDYINLGPKVQRSLKDMAGPGSYGDMDEVDVDYEGTGDEDFDVILPSGGASTPVERFWSEYFQATKEEDALDIDIMCEEITEESTAPMLLRVLSLLLMAGATDRRDFPPRDLMKLLGGVASQLFSMGDLDVVRQVLLEEQVLRNRLRPENTVARQFLDEFCEGVIPPARIADLLVNLDYSDQRKAKVAHELLSRMPTEGLLKTMEWGSSYDYEALLPFYKAFLQAAGQRAVTAILNAGLNKTKDRVLISLIRLVRVAALKDDRYKDVRAQLARHPSFPVRLEALAWYGDLDLEQDDVTTFMNALIDTNADIQNAALNVLRISRPIRMRHALEKAIDTRFDRYDTMQKTAVCKAYALVAEDAALAVLKGMLMTRLPLFGEDPKLSATIEAAAKGLLALGSPQAIRLLERQAGNLIPGPRKTICRRVLSEEGQ